MTRFALTLALLGLLACSPATPPPVEPAIQQSSEDGPFRLSVSADRVEISAADSVELTLHAEYPEGAQVALPSADVQLGEFLIEEQEVSPPRLITSGTLAIDQRLTLAPLQPGQLAIPVLEAEATLEDGRTLRLQSTEIPVLVSSLITATEEEPEPGLRDIEDPLEAPIPTSWKVAGLLAAMLAIGALFWWSSYRKPKVIVAPPPPPIPPGQAALARLNALGESGLLEAGQHKEFHFELSDILREYIERRFSIHAQEQTTDEFLAGLPSHRVFTPQQQGLLQDFLLRSDLVKFAKYAPRIEQSRQAAEACRSVIVETDVLGAPRGLVK